MGKTSGNGRSAPRAIRPDHMPRDSRRIVQVNSKDRVAWCVVKPKNAGWTFVFDSEFDGQECPSCASSGRAASESTLYLGTDSEPVRLSLPRTQQCRDAGRQIIADAARHMNDGKPGRKAVLPGISGKTADPPGVSTTRLNNDAQLMPAQGTGFAAFRTFFISPAHCCAEFRPLAISSVRHKRLLFSLEFLSKRGSYERQTSRIYAD